MLAKIAKFLKVIIPALVLGVGFSYLISFAQIPPPPQNNPFPPINTTATDQIKQFANGAGFLGLDYLKDPAPPTTNWGKKAGPSTLCSDPSGKIIICRVYTPPSASLSINRFYAAAPEYNRDEWPSGVNIYREFGAENDLTFTWSVTKNTNAIDDDDLNVTRDINFSTSTSGASITPSKIQSTGGTQSTPSVNGVSAQDITSTFSISAYDVQGISGGPTQASASASVYWLYQFYCGSSATDYFNPLATSLTYGTNISPLGNLFQQLRSNIPAGGLSCTFNNVNNEYFYFMYPASFGAISSSPSSGFFIGNLGTAADQTNGVVNTTNYHRLNIPITNKYGVTTNYFVYRSPSKNTGSATVTIKP